MFKSNQIAKQQEKLSKIEKKVRKKICPQKNTAFY